MVWFPGATSTNNISNIQVYTSDVTINASTDVFEQMANLRSSKIINPDVLVTLSIAAGVYTVDYTAQTISKDGGSAVDISTHAPTRQFLIDANPVWQNVRITGPTPTLLTNVAVVSSTSNGARDHDVVLSADDVSSLVVGRFMKVRLNGAALSHPYLMGSHEITNVNSGSDQFTLKVRAVQASITLSVAAVTGLDFQATEVTFKWTNFSGAFPNDWGGLEYKQGADLYQIDGMILVGDRAYTGTDCVMAREGSHFKPGTYFGGAGWGRNLVYMLAGVTAVLHNFAGSDAVSNGVYGQTGVNVASVRAGVSGCSVGWAVTNSSSMVIGSAAGCSTGVQIIDGGQGQFGATSVIADNVTNIYVYNKGFADLPDGIIVTRGQYGVRCGGGGSVHVATEADVTGNTVANYAPAFGVMDGTGSIITDDQIPINDLTLAGTITLIGTASNSEIETNNGHLELKSASSNRDIIFQVAATDAEKSRIDMDDGSYVFISGVRIVEGTGTPEGAVTAPIGSLFLRRDGGAGTSMYIKESGTGNTGWVPK